MAGTKSKADLKVIILGAATVGKTSLIQRYLHGTFDTTKATIGASFFLKQWDGYHVAIWDTAGEEKYKSLSSFYARNASAAILSYDITDPSSFQSLQRSYLHLLETAKPDCLCAVVACKVDLTGPDTRRVEASAGRDFAKLQNESRSRRLPAGYQSWECAYFETSSKTGKGVMDVFDFLQSTLVERLPPSEAASSLPASLAHTLSVADSDRSAAASAGSGSAGGGSGKEEPSKCCA